jgi:hypothetical protein
MTSRKEKKRERQRGFPIPGDGGLQKAQQLLRLRHMENFDLSLDVVFVATDFEVSRRDKGKGVPPFKQFSMATLDTRDLRSEALLSPGTKYISTQQLSTSHASKDFFDCDFTDFKECVFAETHFVSRDDLAATIVKSLHIQDIMSSDSKALRNIVLVGHSIICGIIYLQQLGIGLYATAPVVAIPDALGMAKHVLGRGYTLSALLNELECPCKASDFHNAGNDATYTLHAMLMLTIKSGEGRELSLLARKDLDYLRAMVQVGLHECPRWKPPRRPVGFYATESPG